jgi:hypothetical protein
MGYYSFLGIKMIFGRMMTLDGKTLNIVSIYKDVWVDYINDVNKSGYVILDIKRRRGLPRNT